MAMNSMDKLAFSVHICVCVCHSQGPQLEKGLLKGHWETPSSKRMELKK